jgi:hypothetical protein
MKDFIDSFGRDIPEDEMEGILKMSVHKIPRYIRRYPMKVVKPIIITPKIDEEE